MSQPMEFAIIVYHKNLKNGEVEMVVFEARGKETVQIFAQIWEEFSYPLRIEIKPLYSITDINKVAHEARPYMDINLKPKGGTDGVPE